MAVIWQARQQNVHYVLHRRGERLQLFANGVQHSEWHPRKLFTGSVWDLLWLPVFFAEPQRIQRVLILGLGAGTVIAPLRHFCQPLEIVAVDSDPLHLQVAEQFFQVAGADISCHCADAVAFVRDYQGAPFDLLIEDLFAPSDSSVTRAVPASVDWCRSLAALVSAEGMRVMNFGDWQEYRDSGAAGAAAGAGFAGRFRLSTADCHNAVLVSTRQAVDSGSLRRHLQAEPLTRKALHSGELDYQIRRLG